MAIQMQEPQSGKQRRHKKFPRMLLAVVSIVLIVILAFVVGAFLILKSQGIAQGSTTLTLISIIVGVTMSILGLLFAFLQWYYPRHAGEHDRSTPSHHPSELISPIGQVPLSQNQT